MQEDRFVHCDVFYKLEFGCHDVDILAVDVWPYQQRH